MQPFGTLGTAGRNILEGPGTNNVDFSLLKNIALTERHRLQFRSEFFNLFNRTNFDFPERICTVPTTAAPGASCTGGTFGRLTAARRSAHPAIRVEILVLIQPRNRQERGLTPLSCQFIIAIKQWRYRQAVDFRYLLSAFDGAEPAPQTAPRFLCLLRKQSSH